MSDKNRNMNDINDQKTAEQQAFSEEIRRRLAEPGSGKPTLDEFKVMVYKDREKRRKKRNALVACIVAAFVVGLFSFEHFVPEVGADKNPKETIQTEDGVIIEDGGWGSSIGDENVWVTEDWEQVKDAKALFPQLLIPKAIPAEYSFERLSVENIVKDDIICEYIFSDNYNNTFEIELFIISGGEESLKIDNVSRTIKSNRGEIYIQEDKERATILIDDGIVVFVNGNLMDNTLVDIIEGLAG